MSDPAVMPPPDWEYEPCCDAMKSAYGRKLFRMYGGPGLYEAGYTGLSGITHCPWCGTPVEQEDD